MKWNRLRDSTLIIRGKVHSASTSTLKEYVAIFGGLTSKVSMIYRDVKELRATISVRPIDHNPTLYVLSNGVVRDLPLKQS